MSDTLSEKQKAAIDKIKAANGAAVKLPVATGAALVNAKLARASGDSSGQRGYGMYVAA